ncbi:hypothetical protein L226DRAFT_525846 [Lentinus tigrinus ALCF2SS1-7]|uniref:Uncharacterized protein n=1 Tax=Lentinus tigrinus ALCF2SS1-6 TaxID=1328759 RepID=A0A5C2RRM1_9APHY|nr:hypothetical protein L227DRAFT_567771 [Lentinus tigrinus ALCF2SS1-6]RPD70546.1 hypothetical protein L226DRAFT_525846 [Lentinus tigrinus ALCF2SS1-7]
MGWTTEWTLQLFNAMKGEDEQRVGYNVPGEYTLFNRRNVIVCGPLRPTVRSTSLMEHLLERDACFNFKRGADMETFLVCSPKNYFMQVESKRDVATYIRTNFTHWLALADKFGV